MRKRERENPCFVCGHYHKFEDGEVCGICGHRLKEAAESTPQQSAFSTEILPSFLYLGSYDNASRSELLKAQGISRILNTVPACQNLYKNSFTYYSLKGDTTLPFDECLDFIEQTRIEGARVLVHCMSGSNRSPAVVIAYLMRHKGWRLQESHEWVKTRRPSINLSGAVIEQLRQYESKLFGSSGPVSAVTQGSPFPSASSATTETVASAFSFSVSEVSPPRSVFGNGHQPENFVFGAARESSS